LSLRMREQVSHLYKTTQSSLCFNLYILV
jgi:hypothetical protein